MPYFTENMYRKGARRWRKLYRMNGHLFQAKRFSKVTVKTYKLSYTQASYGFGLWLYGTVVILIFIAINFLGLTENKTFVDFLFFCFATIKDSCYIYHSLSSEFHGSWFNGTNKNNENWYSTEKNEFTVVAVGVYH